jgi:hypothetical protein
MVYKWRPQQRPSNAPPSFHPPQAPQNPQMLLYICITARVGHRTAPPLQGTPRRVPQGSPGPNQKPQKLISCSIITSQEIFGLSEKNPRG